MIMHMRISQWALCLKDVCFNVKEMPLFFQMHLLVVESLSYIFCASWTGAIPLPKKGGNIPFAFFQGDIKQ